MSQVFLAVMLVCAVQLVKTEGAWPGPCRTLGDSCVSAYELSICTSRRADPTIVRCSHPTPYCRNGACVSIPDTAEYGRYLTRFTCPHEDGTYPDPNTCHGYRICTGGQDTFYSCTIDGADTNPTYSDGSHSCLRYSNAETWDTWCYTSRCLGSDRYSTVFNNLNQIATKKNYYFLCSNGIPTLVQRCPEGLVFDSAKQRCTFVCQYGNHWGVQRRYPDPDGTGTTFIECTYISTKKLREIRRTCPYGSIFDSAKLECVLEEAIQLGPN